MVDLLMLVMLAAGYAGAFAYVCACDGMTCQRGPASQNAS